MRSWYFPESNEDKMSASEFAIGDGAVCTTGGTWRAVKIRLAAAPATSDA